MGGGEDRALLLDPHSRCRQHQPELTQDVSICPVSVGIVILLWVSFIPNEITILRGNCFLLRRREMGSASSTFWVG